MKRLFTFLCLALGIALVSQADTTDVPTADTEVLDASHFMLNTLQSPSSPFSAEASSSGKYQFFKSVQVEKPYKFKDDMTYVGFPLIAAGLLMRSERTYFRQDHTNPDANPNDRLLTNFHTKIDNFTQFAPLVLATGLKLGGVDGRSDWGRYIISAGLSYAIMAAIVNPVKYSFKEMRPDGSTANSFPSGHTATAFVGATILHKEYGLTHSPWYSIGGYAIATATGVMRVLNNRHWISDVLAGAGVGILSTELAYGISDLIFKGRGLRRTDMVGDSSIVVKPSFFSIDMGVGFGNRHLDFHDEEDGSTIPFRFKSATVVGAEGAYFFNKYVGVGGRVRVRATAVQGFGDILDDVNRDMADIMTFINPASEAMGTPIIDTERTNITIESDHLTEFTGSLGAYFNLPLSRHFALGGKVLVGRSVIDAIDLSMHMAGTSVRGTETTGYVLGDPYDEKWDLVRVTGKNGMTYGAGISVTYAYKSNFSWRFFADYDYARRPYTLTYNLGNFLTDLFPDEFPASDPNSSYRQEITTKKRLHQFTIGGSFCVSF